MRNTQGMNISRDVESVMAALQQEIDKHTAEPTAAKQDNDTVAHDKLMDVVKKILALATTFSFTMHSGKSIGTDVQRFVGLELTNYGSELMEVHDLLFDKG